MKKNKIYGLIIDAFDAIEAECKYLMEEADENAEELTEDRAWDWSIDSVMDDLHECIAPEIDRKAPHGIAVFADLGLWNGRRRGIKIVESFADVLRLCDDLTYVRIESTPQGLEVYAPHHDGTNIYTLRALTEAGANRWSDYDDDLEHSLMYGSPRTLRRYTRNIKNLWRD